MGTTHHPVTSPWRLTHEDSTIKHPKGSQPGSVWKADDRQKWPGWAEAETTVYCVFRPKSGGWWPGSPAGYAVCGLEGLTADPLGHGLPPEWDLEVAATSETQRQWAERPGPQGDRQSG